jgi:type I restriction enzyme S subunit
VCVIDAVYFEDPFTFKNEMWAYTTEERTTVKYLYYVLKNNIQYFKRFCFWHGVFASNLFACYRRIQNPPPTLACARGNCPYFGQFTELTAELTSGAYSGAYSEKTTV